MIIETKVRAREEKETGEGLKIWFRLPRKVIDNPSLGEAFWREGVRTKSGKVIDSQWIIDHTGISKRYEEPSLPHLGVPFRSLITALETLKFKNWSPQNLDFIAALTSFPVGQNLALYLKEELAYKNAKEKENLRADVLEVNAACAGFTVFLHYLQENEESFLGKRILLVAAEQYSHCLNGFDRAIFSDFTLGMAFKYGEDFRVLQSHLVYEKDEKELIRMPIKHHHSSPFLSYEIPQSPRFLEMEGPEVFHWAGKRVPEVIKELKEKSGFDWNQIKMIIPHQANERITKVIQERVPVLVLSNIKEYGNTSSASIPLALFEAQKEGLVKKGDKVIFVGFGAGLLICANLIQFGAWPR